MTTLKNSHGFSSIELMVTSVLIVISLLGVAGLLQSSSFKNNSSKAYTTGATLSEQIMEQQKTLGFGAVVNGSTNITIDGITYTCSRTVTSITANGVTGRLTRVNVTVQWGNTADKRIQTAIYLARPA